MLGANLSVLPANLNFILLDRFLGNNSRLSIVKDKDNQSTLNLFLIQNRTRKLYYPNYQ